MLSRFSVVGFKNFEEEIVFDLTKTKNYEFNTNVIKDGCVKTALVYGVNGSGKSNLGLAIFDIMLHLSDKQRSSAIYENYLNLDAAPSAKFQYTFLFDGTKLEYMYEKEGDSALLSEEIKIDNKRVLYYDFTDASKAEVNLEGSGTLNLDLVNNGISFVKYVAKNTKLRQNKINSAFYNLIMFAENMLLFSSLEKNYYQGFTSGDGKISDSIISTGNLESFEQFLKENNICYKLKPETDADGVAKIMCEFNKGTVDFFRIASRGTLTLALFYHWYIYLKDQEIPFVFIDEFDAFYHSETAKIVIGLVKKLPKAQAIFTSHNTDIMTNDLLRPDCYFYLRDGCISALSELTSKDLRKAHNLQKMYKAGAFNSVGE